MTMKTYFAEDLDRLEIKVGQSIALESLRESVRPPYLMLMPTINAPEGLEVIEQRALEGEGVHGCTFIVEATRALQDTLTIGFKDLQSGETTHEKEIIVIATDP